MLKIIKCLFFFLKKKIGLKAIMKLLCIINSENDNN